MSETMGTGGASGPDEMRDEVRLDLDEQKLDTWEDVRGDYAVDPESDVARPAVSEPEETDASGPTGDVTGAGDDDRVLVEGEAHDDLDMAPDGTSADDEE